ncbi:hypothetical protein H7J88_07735 [Mycolicibacterium flavescens]|uniref:DUF5642 domain-containing protein n=1 Tax=Mycolicibacterium flavescens TaxID=1776 RepID=A0A1E3RQL9_MYCFV|nr:hypothetical protein [Mycolicibacterium flavescens]MCV7279536.1 hypothetical protein [Mycolicibacterium flavescens]ODQ92195.1 hypothetical protein BHQ18_00145 [Mycolicibacterium flavescens]
MVRRFAAAAVLLLVVSGCGHTVTGAATWPGARLERAVLTAGDFPPGVQYDRITREPGQADGAGGPPAMLSKPAGCSDALTRVIAESAERGAGSAAEYVVAYDGARMVFTVLTWPLDLDRLAAAAERCATFETYFDPSSPGIPMTTNRMPSPRADALVYQQTMRLAGADNSVYFSFENVGAMAVYGIAFPTPNPSVTVKGSLPQTFLDIAARQADRIAAA